MWRTTPSQISLPGAATFIVVFKGSPTLIMLPVAQLLAQGIALKNLSFFLENGDPNGFVQKHGVLFHAKMSDLVFVPTGWVALATNLGLNGGGPCALMMLPVLHKKMLEGVDPMVVNAVKEYNMSFFSTKDSPLWTGRQKAFSEVYSS